MERQYRGAASLMQPKCGQCKKDAKYKCPKTRIRYCSVKCYKLIQKGADEGKIKPLPETLSDQTGLPSLMQNVTEEQIKWKGVVQDDQRKFNASTWQKYDDEDDRLPESKLNLLDSSDEIKNLLANPHLWQMLSYMDSAKDKEQCIEKAMQEPIFVEFADACLKLVESDSDEEKPPQPKEGFIEVKEFELIQF